MLKLTKQKFKKFPESNKSMIYLMGIYNFGYLISALFISIYIFKLQTRISDVIMYNIIFFIFCFIGFVGIGYLFGIFRKNIKYVYYLSYLIFIVSFIILFIFKGTIFGTYLFGICYGLGFGAFWCAVHSNELTNINDNDRDFYSSLISASGIILHILTPLLVALIFYITNIFNYNGYYILFIIIPLTYFISFFFIKNTGDYIPSKINRKDIKNFFNIKKYIWGHFYIFLTGTTHALKVVIIPIISLLILKNEVNIGIFESLMGLVSFFIVIFLSHIRNQGNRLKILLIVSFLILLTYLFFSVYFNLLGYIIFSLVLIVLNPIYRVSEHVYDLKIMDTIKNTDSDFFPSMLLREVIINSARIIMLLASLYLSIFLGNNLEFLLKILLVLSGIMYLLSWLAIKMHVVNENYNNIEDLH